MSLFSSAFEAGLPAGPSFTSLPSDQHGKNKKRKRDSSASEAVGNDKQLKGMQRNLEKIMSRADGPGLEKKVSKRDGSEPMGSFVKGKRRQRNQARDEQEETNAAIRPGAKLLPAKISKKDTLKPKADSSKARRDSSKAQRHDSPARPAVHSATAKPDPAELPMPHSTTTKARSTASPQDGLTSLQQGMRAKLDGARFRWINEQLYSTASAEAVLMMKREPQIFADYHNSHRVLTSVWPSPPLPHLIDMLTPLPQGTIIADLGCGDAGLAKALLPQGKVVLSYDLVGDQRISGGGWVIEADFLEGVPLPGRTGGSGGMRTEGAMDMGRKSNGKAQAEGCEVVDVVVCCLSLMGINWVGGIYEACRILRKGGTLHIAEVTSRFISTEAFVSKIESFGFSVEKQESPSTHFTLFRFAKGVAVPAGPVRGERGWDGRVKEGEAILRGCVYKKR